ncbi:MAG: hypothetical protein KGR46_06955 [Verrucomicrobia bacterium]|nr:hypothetical protein [Verrucomicrobiota bacterium]
MFRRFVPAAGPPAVAAKTRTPLPMTTDPKLPHIFAVPALAFIAVLIGRKN